MIRQAGSDRTVWLPSPVRAAACTIGAGSSSPLSDHGSARDLGQVLAPWSERIGDARFETEGVWRQKSLGGGSRTVDLPVREPQDGLR